MLHKQVSYTFYKLISFQNSKIVALTYMLYNYYTYIFIKINKKVYSTNSLLKTQLPSLDARISFDLLVFGLKSRYFENKIAILLIHTASPMHLCFNL